MLSYTYTVITSPTNTTTTHRTTSKKHRHHDLPNLPAPGGFIFKGECDRRMSRDRSRSLQSGDVIFLDATKKSFILLTTILCASTQHARGRKVSFQSEYSCFLLRRCIEKMRTDPSYSPISFLPRPSKSSSCFGMNLLGRRGAIAAMVKYDRAER